MLVKIFKSADDYSKAAARVIARLIGRKPDAVLGLATGSTPVPLYNELIRLHQEEALDFCRVTTFNLDEYVGITRTHSQSYHAFMKENLFSKINIPSENIHVPNGTVENIEQQCEWYEERIRLKGGIDLQVLGIGGNGHIAFNEPGSSLGSRTRIKTLSERTRDDNSRFFDSMDKVPKYAITMGIGTIMESHRLLLLASGKSKAKAIKNTVEGPITAMVPATIVQMHRYAMIYIDEAAASALSREYEKIKPEDVARKRSVTIQL
ncbi:MAG: glucosamine-6-phosphate deaminase [Candidatus Neomarinimicrobiota bacterium]